MHSELLRRTAELAIDFVESLPERPVPPSADLATLQATLGGELPEKGIEPAQVIGALARDADPGLMSSAGPRFLGFIIGGSLPVALAADWLTSAWDQNAAGYVLSPAVSVLEDTAGRWLIELLGLPPETSCGFTTGTQMAHLTALAAARHGVLRRAGWDVEMQGLHGGPDVHVVLGQEAHVTIYGALRYLGLGMGRATVVPADDQGRIQPAALRDALAGLDGPTIVCAQAGEVNTGSVDPLAEIADIAREHEGVWLHIDGAFGLWAAAVPSLRHLVAGHERADSWACDAHKWLNVPYDSGLVFVRDAAAHRASSSLFPAYRPPVTGAQRDGMDYVPEFSRRGRGVAVYATLRALGREGLIELVERGCRHARMLAQRLSAAPGVEVLNEVALNQVLFRFSAAGSEDPADADRVTQQTVANVVQSGTCWLNPTMWGGRPALHASFSNWWTSDDDVERSAAVILESARAAGAG